MNQLFQAEVFSSPTTRPTTQAVGSTVRTKVVQDSREQQEDFSAVVEEVMKKSESAETGTKTETKIETEKKATSSNSSDELNLSALAGLAFLLSDLSVEQTAVNADNLSEEENKALTEAMLIESGRPLTGEVASQSSSDGRMTLEGEAVTGENVDSSGETMESSVETKEHPFLSEKESSPADLEGEVPDEVTKAGSLAKGGATTEQARLNSEDGVGRVSDQDGLEQEGTMEQFSKSLKETVGNDRNDGKAGKEGEDRSSGLTGEPKFAEALAGAKDYTSVKNAGEFSNLEFNPTDFTVSSRLSSVAESAQSSQGAGEFYTNLTDQIELAEKVVKQIQTGARVMVKDGVARVEMHLEPKELGKLELSLVIDRDVVAARFVAESQTVQSIIESNLDNLRSSLQEAGLKADLLQVGVETGGFDGQNEPTFYSKQGFQFAGMDFLAEENEEFQVAQAQVWGRVDFRA